MMQENGSQQDTDKHILDILIVGAVIPIITYNGYSYTSGFVFHKTCV
jgi:hypothetical protein